jgi:hypothetical protein
VVDVLDEEPVLLVLPVLPTDPVDMAWFLSLLVVGDFSWYFKSEH